MDKVITFPPSFSVKLASILTLGAMIGHINTDSLLQTVTRCATSEGDSVTQDITLLFQPSED